MEEKEPITDYTGSTELSKEVVSWSKICADQKGDQTGVSIPHLRNLLSLSICNRRGRAG